MTKLKLNLAQGAGEILTREELKKIVGGTEGSGSGSSCSISFTCPDKSTTVSCNGTYLCEPYKKNGVQIGVECDKLSTAVCKALA